MKLWLLILLVMIVAGFAVSARAGVIDGGPNPLRDTRSLRYTIDHAHGAVHIVFVHGIRATGPNYTEAFRRALLRNYHQPNGSGTLVERHYIDLPPPQRSMVAGVEVWVNEREWRGSRPFVDRYRLDLGEGKIVLLDEVNWWPLVFPLKCRLLLVPEHDLSGNDKAHLELCAREHEPYYPWLSQAKLKDLLTTRPRSGGAPWLNRAGKQQIMNWGLADAVIALGPMRRYFVAALDQAFEYASAGAEKAGATDRVVISESLGSFLVLDAYEAQGSAQAYLDRTDDLYFFANQFALLELARIELGPPAGLGARDAIALASTILPSDAIATRPPSPFAGLLQWGKKGARSRSLTAEPVEHLKPRQLVAFSDSADLLTYRVPKIDSVWTVNLYVRNATRWLGLFANPVQAHTGQVGNPDVWKVMLRPENR